MPDPSSPATFDQKRASAYDQRIPWAIPGYESLHALTLDLLSSALPGQARLLIAGAGTGMEILTLGAARPGWRFTAADPSAPMLDTLQARINAASLQGAVTVRNAFVRDLPAEDTGFDAATSMLVSHFITDTGERTGYFHSIAQRLKPGATLVFADMFGDRSSAAFAQLLAAWRTRFARSGADPKEIEAAFSRMESDVSTIPESVLLGLVQSAGFSLPVPFWRGLVFGGWTAKRNA